MLKNKLKNYMANHEDGFTIIEVIIVLVIGAVIMLAVFLVVPQLQRSQRNARQQDNARRVLTGIQQFASANQNAFPPDGAAVLQVTDTLVNPVENVNLAGNDIQVGAVETQYAPERGKMVIINNAKCSGSNNTTSSSGSYSVIVGLETATTYCVNT